MSDAFPTPELLADLRAVLCGRLGLAECASLDDLAKQSSAGVLLNARLTAAGELDVNAEAFIVDPVLGTVGLVHALNPRGDIEQQLRRHVDRATYLRHLLVTDPERKGRLARTVELVLMVPLGEAEGAAALERVGSTLRGIAREAAFLHHIGVSVLRHGRDADQPCGSDAELRRAFPWLLSATGAWFQQLAAPKPAARADAVLEAPLRFLALENYRLAGRRTWEPDPAAAVHLLHGQNGTGKSSITESLEWLVCGVVDRLKGRDDYGAIVRHRGSPTPARLELRCGTPERTRAYVVERPRPDDAVLGEATSFRLDQVVMDRLARQHADERASTFLKGFFPEEEPKYKPYLEALEASDKAFQQLSQALREEIERDLPAEERARERAVIRRFEWLGRPETALPAQAVADCLPLPLEVLDALAPMSATLAECAAAWRRPVFPAGEVKPQLQQLDATLERLRREFAKLHTAREALERIKDWQPQGQQHPVKKFAAALNQWLELSALADIGEKQYLAGAALAEARGKGWQGSEDAEAVLALPPAPSELERLRKQIADWSGRKAKLFDELMHWGKPEGESEPGAARHELNLWETEALNAAGRWICTARAENPPLLGASIDTALREERHEVCMNLTIGSGPEWAKPLIESLAGLQTAAQAAASAPSGLERLAAFEQARKTSQAALDTAGLLKDTFLAKIAGAGDNAPSGLNAALNELMALFTPARWAYSDIAVRHRVAAGGHKIELTTEDGSVDAALRLNTAELNLFTVALFLLCAPRLANPLRLLVFDDPLQNMDELTVTALARGIAKVARLLAPRTAGGPAPADEWKLVLLFHDEDDLERFRLEVPSAVYLLPWLSPSAAEGAPLPIHRDALRSDPRAEFQEIAGLIGPQEPAPRQAAVGKAD